MFEAFSSFAPWDFCVAMVLLSHGAVPASQECLWSSPKSATAQLRKLAQERGAPAAGRFLEELQRLALRVNMIHLNTVMASLAAEKHWSQALLMFTSAPGVSLQRSLVSFSTVIGRGGWRLAASLLSLLQSSAAQANDVCMNTVIKSAVRGHQWQLAAHVMAGMPSRALTPNSISGSTLLSACEKSRSWRRALHLRWGEDAYSASTIGWNAAASACVDVWPQGLALLDTMPAMEILPDTISHNIGLALSPSWACALRFPPSPDSVTFGTAITGLKQGRRWRFATLLLGSMTILRVQEVCRSFSSCSSACEQEALWEPVLALLRRMRIVSIRGDEVGMNSLISACGQHGHWCLALGALHGMPGGQLAPDQISMNSVIAACRTGALWRLALRLLCRCMLVELLPSAVTFNSLLGALEPETSWPRLLASLNHMREHLVSPNIISFNTGIQLLEKGPRWSCCLQLLDVAGRLSMRRDAVSLTVVLNSVVGSGRSGLWFWALAAMAGARREGLRSSNASLGVAIQSAVSGSHWSRALDLLDDGLPTELSRLAAVEACEMGSLHLAAASLLGEVTATTSAVIAALRKTEKHEDVGSNDCRDL
eukprot:s939_g3.t1